MTASTHRRLEKREPIIGPWQQNAVSRFMESVESGGEITGAPEVVETDGLCCTLPLIAK